MKHLDICGIDFTVEDRTPNARDDGNYGKCDAKMGKIYIDKTMPEDIRESTLIHEWIHGVYEQYGVAHEEQHVSVLAAELYRAGFRLRTHEVPDEKQ